MTTLKIDIRGMAASTHPDDRVILYAPEVRARIGGGLVSTAPLEVDLVDGQATVENVEPGPLIARFECLGIADTTEKRGIVPDSGEATLADVLELKFTWTPPIITAGVQQIIDEMNRAVGTVGSAVDGAMGGLVRSAESAARAAAQASAGSEVFANAAHVRAASAETMARNTDSRVVALEALGGLSPESPVDGQNASLILQKNTLTSKALDTGYVTSNTIVSVDNPQFGAVADWDGTSGTDNTDAIRAAIAYARTLGAGAVLLYPQGPGRGYYVSKTIEHGPDLSVDMRVPVYHPGGGVTIRFGSASKLTNSSATYTIRVARTTQSDWSDQNDTGAEMVNVARTNINILLAANFTTGVRLVGDGAGFVTCNVQLGQLANNQTHLNLHNRNGGWTNSNTFIGGYALNLVGLNRGKPRCAVSYTSEYGFHNDGNIFLGLCSELKVDDALGAEVEIIRSEYGQLNKHENIRSETSGPVAIRNFNNSRFNDLSISYSQIAVGGYIDNSQAERATGLVTELRQSILDRSLRSIWRSDEMHTIAAQFTGGSVHVPGISWRVAGTSNAGRTMTFVDVRPDCLEFSSDRAAGVYVSTQRVKRLVATADTVEGFPGRWVIKAFRADGSVVTTTGAVKQGAAVGLFYAEFFGGAWLSSIGTHGAVDFSVSAEVDYIWVGLSGDAGVRAKVVGMEILTHSPIKARAWQPWDDRGMNWGSVPPAAGTYQVGRTVMNVAPAPGQPLGWVCTAAGSPGTWAPMQSLPVI